MSKVKDWMVKVKEAGKAELKNPWFYLGFCITWVLLESPIIFGLIMFLLTKDNKYMVIVTSWFALTAPALPIPVIPLSIAGGLITSKISRIIKKNKKGE